MVVRELLLRVLLGLTFATGLMLGMGCDRRSHEIRVEDSTPDSRPTVASLDEARRLIAAGDFAAARLEIDRYLLEHPSDVVAWEMAGDGATQAKDYATAIKCFESAVKAATHPSQELWFKWAGATIAAERPFDTVAVLRDAVLDYPDVLEIRQNLTSFLAQLGLQNEAAEHLRWLVQRKHASQSVLYILSDLTRPQTIEATCRAALLKNPQDLRPVFSLALHHVTESNWQEVEKALAPVVKQHPDFLPALALYGRSLVELNQAEAVQAWSQALPREIESESNYWMAAGNWAYRRESFKQSARAYWSAVRLNENDSEALHALSVSLGKLGRQGQADLAASRAAKLAQLRSHMATLSTWDFNSQQAVVDLARTLQELGRLWEAANWLMIGHSMNRQLDPRLEQTYLAIRNELTGATPWQLPEQAVSTKMDLATYPMVVWSESGEDVSPALMNSSDGNVRFRDEAELRSLNHVCNIRKSGNRESGLMIYQSGAGGVGVIDFDLDGWPDLYLTVMDGMPGHQDSAPNRLHRNQAGEFLDVTNDSLLIDHGFSQGLSVADYNADGWPDVYVANIGRNRLYRNNGDGTFADVTDQCKLHGTGWTTSVAIADLNNDGHADLYEVGYCRGEKPLTLQCIVPMVGEARSCNPMAFDSEPDRIWEGSGDGTFTDATDWFGPHEAGRGFALVIGDLDHRQPGLETYVANDMTANHYWARAVDASGFELSEEAAIRGLAFNHRSIAQASMGIAAADADNDGDVDFLLTHFVDDHNTYYRQDRPGIWSDESQRAGFADSSRLMLAYGTQWIDVDNDGSLEVFIANGDIDDFQFEGRAFRQPAQLLRQVAQGRWQVMQADRLGDYFGKDRLARAVATLDANRDGLSDLIVTHLFDPVGLLINRSDTSAKQTRFFLRARSSHRDAIGARIRLASRERVFEQQLLAGNGFQCVNEGCIVFGVSDAEMLQDAQVIWPGGETESLGNLEPGGDYWVVEGLGVSRF